MEFRHERPLTEKEMIEALQAQYPDKTVGITPQGVIEISYRNDYVLPDNIHDRLTVDSRQELSVPQTRAERLIDEEDRAALNPEFASAERLQTAAPEIGVRARVATLADFDFRPDLLKIGAAK